MFFARVALALIVFLPTCALAGTFNPDPSLGLSDERRHLYDIARHYLDTNFDPAANLVGGSSRHPPNTKIHWTGGSAYYVYTLLLTGDPADNARAQAVLPNVLKSQDTNPDSATYGVFGWNTEQAPTDLNSAEFVGLTLGNILDWDKTHHVLAPDLARQLEHSFRLAVGAVLRRDVDPGYTNIAFLSVAVAAAGQKLLAIPDTGAFAESKLDAIMALANQGEMAEYLSPTYYGVGLVGAYSAQHYSFSPSFATKVQGAIDHYWKQIALAYHPPSYQLCGPYLRAYGNDMLEYAAPLKYWLYLARNGDYPLPDTETGHDWDKAGTAALAVFPFPPRPEFNTPPPAWRVWNAVTPNPAFTRELRQYRADNFILGTIATQDEYAQKRNLVAYWRNPGPPPLNMTVGYCLDESNESIPGFPGERLHFYSQQVKDAALVSLVAAAAVPGQGTSHLVFNDSAVASAIPSVDGALQIQDGSITVYLYPVTNEKVSFATVSDPAHHTFSINRSWNASDFVGNLHVIAYVVVFRPTGQAPPNVSDLKLTVEGDSVTAAASVDGAPLTQSFKN